MKMQRYTTKTKFSLLTAIMSTHVLLYDVIYNPESIKAMHKFMLTSINSIHVGVKKVMVV